MVRLEPYFVLSVALECFLIQICLGTVAIVDGLFKVHDQVGSVMHVDQR